MGLMGGIIPDEIKELLASSTESMEAFSQGIDKIANLLSDANEKLDALIDVSEGRPRRRAS